MEYTLKIHRQRLKRMLEETPGDILCFHCPTARFADNDDDHNPAWEKGSSIKECKICLSFIGLKYDPEGHKCPCFQLELDEVLKRSYEALGM